MLEAQAWGLGSVQDGELDVRREVGQPRDPAVMIVSYETLRTLSAHLANCSIGLLLCDEGHRLKNSGEFPEIRRIVV